MTTTKNLIISLIFTFWIILAATFSIQNIQLVSLRFFFLESIQIPIGILLSMMLGFGLIFGAILPLFFNKKKKLQNKSTKKRIMRESEAESDPLFDWE